jgi:hypothetical protein
MTNRNRLLSAAFLSLFLGLVLLPVPARSGANETPGQNYRPHTFSSYSTNTWEFGLTDVGIFQGIVVASQHYTQGATYQDNANDLNSGGAGIWNFFTFCTNRAADVMLVTSHGWNNPTTTVEMYPWTARGLAVRDSVFNYYNGIFAAGSIIKREWAGTTHAIDVTQTFYTTYFQTPQAFCWWATCWSSGLNMTGAAEARCYLGYDQVVASTKCYCDERRILQRMDGQEGLGMRPLGAALANINGLCPPGGARLQSQGRLNTVLSPSVLAMAPTGIVCGPTPGFVLFDCTMDRTVPPASVVVAYGDGYLTNHQWAGDDRVTFDVIPTTPCPVILYDVKEAAARSFADRARLDGNTNPAVNALGPNQDDFIWVTFCPYCPVPVTTPDATSVPDDAGPGVRTQAVIAVSNNTDNPITVQVEVADLLGWVGTPPQVMTLAAHDGRWAFFDIFVSQTATPGTVDPYTVTITGAGDPVIAHGQVTVGGRLSARLASSSALAAGQTNQVDVLVENRTTAPVHLTSITLTDGLGWPITSQTPVLDLTAGQSSLASFLVQVPPATPPGTTNPLTFHGTIEPEFVLLEIEPVKIGLPLKLKVYEPIDIVPGNSDARFQLEIQNPAPVPYNGLLWTVADLDGHFSGLTVAGPPSLPPSSSAMGQIVGGLGADPTLVGRGGTLRLTGRDPSGAEFEALIPYVIEPAIAIVTVPPSPCTGFASPHNFPWIITLRNRSDVPLNGMLQLQASGVAIAPPSFLINLSPNMQSSYPTQLTIMPDSPPGEQTATVIVQTHQVIGDTRGTYPFAVTNPVLVHMIAREMSGTQGSDVLVEGTIKNVRTDRSMSGIVQWSDNRGWLLPPLFGTYSLSPGGESAISATLHLPAGSSLRDAPIDSALVSATVTMTYDTGVGAQERAEIVVRVMPSGPADVPPTAGTTGRDGIERITPNPFLPSTRVDFRLSVPGPARLTVFDATGRLVAVLADGPLPAGSHARVWEARSLTGSAVPAGVYFIRLETPLGRWTEKVIRLR